VTFDTLRFLAHSVRPTIRSALQSSVADIRIGFDADPDTATDPAFLVNADPDPDPGL
jgi:hypothetical protein